ncbi:hypothetical protein Mal15_57580 [Stieleria maiorica]|uniref:SD-repeat containing protein B domain-containing protein n=2 Tax=Stieleria maiorica TaxID=2795974 RepID=A0A5B9MMP2_9BACT|nr:hypothetical protein Mal15_57580 [Stieleria maiorica]
MRRSILMQRLERRQLLHAAGVITGNVFWDSDGDGSRGAVEAGVPGVVVDLSSGDGAVSRSAITDNRGNYAFDELEHGEYRISKRAMRAVESATDVAVRSLTLEDGATVNVDPFAQQAMRPEFITIGWFFASSPPESELVRRAIALGEELDGHFALAESIRSGGQQAPVDVNEPPLTQVDSYQTDVNEPLSVGVNAGVLANDFDRDGDPLTALIVSQPDHGTVVLNSNGAFTYVPETDFVGVDTFTYRAGDGRSDSGVTTVTITVTDPSDSNQIPTADGDSYEVSENTSLVINAAGGVLANDRDADGDALTAQLVTQPSNGTLSLNSDGSFTYQPNAAFFGTDSFTYVASDGIATSGAASVSIRVAPVDDGTAFASVTTGSFTDPSLLGTRTDLVAGAPAITANHVDGEIDYSNHSNPPTYGDHHGFDPNGTDSNPGITPRPTGIYTTEQPDEDLIHNLEHGHVWISYNPNLISTADIAALEQLVRDGTGDANGNGVGVILTPRAANDDAIALASWARLLTLDQYAPSTIRDFVNTNRGKAPEGFITP